MGDVIDLKERLGAEVIPLFHGARAEHSGDVNGMTSHHNGEVFPEKGKNRLRAAHADAAMELARDADARQQEHVKRNARIERATRRAAEAISGKRLDPDLLTDLAAEINHIAQMLEAAAERAKSYGLLSTTVALREHAGLLEAESALVKSEVRG